MVAAAMAPNGERVKAAASDQGNRRYDNTSATVAAHVVATIALSILVVLRNHDDQANPPSARPHSTTASMTAKLTLSAVKNNSRKRNVATSKARNSAPLSPPAMSKGQRPMASSGPFATAAFGLTDVFRATSLRLARRASTAATRLREAAATPLASTPIAGTSKSSAPNVPSTAPSVLAP